MITSNLGLTLSIQGHIEEVRTSVSRIREMVAMVKGGIMQPQSAPVTPYYIRECSYTAWALFEALAERRVTRDFTSFLSGSDWANECRYLAGLLIAGDYHD